MRSVFLAAAALACTTFVASASVRAQKLPQPSPAAEIEQTVGITEIEVEYSSPAVKGRVILGKLLPFDSYWRSGANAATRISFDNDVTFAGKMVKAGEYRLGTIPTRKGWMVVLDEQFDGSPTAFDPGSAIVNTKVKAKATRSRERLTYLFENTTDTATDLVLEWSTFKVIIPIEVDTDALVAASVDQSVGDSWRSLMRIGRYLTEDGQHDKAIEHLDASLAVKETWWATWYKAEAMAAKGKKKEALELANRTKTLAEGDNVFDQFFKKDVDQALVAWAK